MPDTILPHRVTDMQILIGILVLTLTGCAHYAPAISLDESPKTIQIRVKMKSLANRTTNAGSGWEWGERDVVSPRFMEGDLSTLVSHAILKDFQENFVFQSIRKNEDNPDLVLDGEIRQFSERIKASLWAVFPVVGFFYGIAGGSLEEHDAKVDLLLTLSNPAGQEVGRYAGQVQFVNQITLYDSEGWGNSPGFGHRLNGAFTEAVRQIRGQFLRDREQIESKAAKAPTSPPFR